jgi:hypothetical protein
MSFLINHELSKKDNLYKFYTHFYYLYGNWDNIPVATVCLLISSEKDYEILARGIAIRSYKDPHNKKTGRNKALGRAIKALDNERTSELINIDATIIVKDKENFCEGCPIYDFFEYKSEFFPVETEQELDMIEKIKIIIERKK